MPEYLAKYTSRAHMFDGGAWMPDPEPHHDEYRFEAENDEEARKKADEHESVIRKKYFGPHITLDSLDQVREVAKKPQTKSSLTAKIKEVHFDEQLEHLVDEEGIRYEGKRFGTISAYAIAFPTSDQAESSALSKIREQAEQRRADAYEITGRWLNDSHQEYDPTPMSATIRAILYKSEMTPEEQMARFEK